MKSPSLLRVNLFILLFILITYALIHAGKVLIPVVFAALLSMLMTPMAEKLEAKKVGRVWTTLLCVFTIIVIIISTLILVGMQFSTIGHDLPQIQEKSEGILQSGQHFIENKFHVSAERQIQALKSLSKSSLQSADSFIKKIVSDLSSTLAALILVIIFMFLFLYQREKYHLFILKLYKSKDPSQAEQVLSQISKVSQHYLIGRLMSIGFLFILFTVGFLIFGVKNAFLYAFIASLLTIVPYIGSIVGGLLPILFVIVTEDMNTAIAVSGVIIFVSALDNYFIEPYVVGGEVNLSAFATILILIIGGYIWGIAGMILFIPLLGIAKIVFDHVDELKPYGYLIGDQKKGTQSKRFWNTIKSLFKK